MQLMLNFNNMVSLSAITIECLFKKHTVETFSEHLFLERSGRCQHQSLVLDAACASTSSQTYILHNQNLLPEKHKGMKFVAMLTAH